MQGFGAWAESKDKEPKAREKILKQAEDVSALRRGDIWLPQPYWLSLGLII
jgi:hypothetical protein